MCRGDACDDLGMRISSFRSRLTTLRHGLTGAAALALAFVNPERQRN